MMPPASVSDSTSQLYPPMSHSKLLRPLRVLLVDDEPSFTRMVKLNLEATGEYQVEVLNDGAKARTTALEFNPDIILLDVVMPVVDGGDVARAIRADSVLKHIPIVFVSAMVSRKETEKGFYVSGGENFISKPTTTEQLISAIDALTFKE